jgi:hypothetical protein
LLLIYEGILTPTQFQGLSDMPPELEWFANLDNPRTRRAYRNDVKKFTAFAGVSSAPKPKPRHGTADGAKRGVREH